MGIPIFDPPLPFARPWLPSLSKVVERFKTSWESRSVTKGPLTEAYEAAVSQYLNTSSAVAVSSCTTGLILTLKALKLEGECLVPAFTFTSTPQALLWSNIKPVFVDCHPNRFTVDMNSLSAEVTSKTSAVLVPYVFGNPPPMEALEQFCSKHKLALIFDAAHAFGTLIAGKPAGRHGKAHVFSTSATKLLCTGEGGMVASQDNAFAESIRSLREYGHGENYETKMQGLNGRMTEFQGLMGLEGLLFLEEQAKRRNHLADLYKKALADLPVTFQEIEPGARSSYKDFALLLEEGWTLTRDEVANELANEGIPTRKYFSPPLHRQEFFLKFSEPVKLLVTENICSKILCLPMFYDLQEAQIEKIGMVLNQLYKNQPVSARGVKR